MRRVLWVSLATLLACGPNPPAPVKVMAIVPNASGTYETQQVELTTVTNLTAMQGSVVTFVGGTRVTIDPNDPLQASLTDKSDSQLYDILVKEKGADPRGNFINRAEVYWPGDYHTWAMVSTFYNFERSFTYFTDIYDGKKVDELQHQKVLYDTELRINSPDPLTDNALYLSLIKAFVVVPPKNSQLVPLAFNIGVIGHEFAHKVFNVRAFGDVSYAPYLSWNGSSFNLMRSLDEGLADFHGYSISCKEAAGCQPNFLKASLADATTVTARDLSKNDACLTKELQTALNNFTADQWVRGPELYRYGTLWASALYQAGNKTGKLQVLQKALVNAYSDTTPGTPGLGQLVSANINTPQLVTPEEVANAIVAHVTDPDLAKTLCKEFSGRLQLKCASFPCTIDGQPAMPACKYAVSRDSTCPVITP